MCSTRVSLFLVSTFLLIHTSYGLTFNQRSGTFARFPRWDACTNASISFEFKTSLDTALLMYTDDNGRSDYVEVMIHDGSVRLRLNVVDGKEGAQEIRLGNRLQDGRWHRVKIQRHRMETILYVDDLEGSQLTNGSDYMFGDTERNNDVFFGGMPPTYYKGHINNLKDLSLPSAFFEARFEGEIRNVIYWNCSCTPVRPNMLEGFEVSREPLEACERSNTCRDCLCISTDDRAMCQCTQPPCLAGWCHSHLLI